MKWSMEEQFVKSCEECADALFRYSFFKVSDRELAKDLVQETYLRTWNYLSRGQAVENLRAFFYRTLSNLIIDEYRKNKPLSLDKLFDDGFDLKTEELERLENQLDGEKAIAMLGRIGKMYQDVIFLKYVEDLSNGEIAKALGESENAVAVKIHRGLKKIKEIFNK